MSGKKSEQEINLFYTRNFSYFHGRYGSALFEKHICDNLKINDNVLLKVIEVHTNQKIKQYSIILLT